MIQYDRYGIVGEPLGCWERIRRWPHWPVILVLVAALIAGSIEAWQR